MNPPFKYSALYMDLAHRVALQSYATRLKVGCVIISPNDSVVSHGWNGMPSGMDNGCEHYDYEALKSVTRPEVLHAELNAIGKAAEEGRPLKNCTVYVTDSPCLECAKLMHRSGISSVVYDRVYRRTDGIEFLQSRGVNVYRYRP